MKRSECDNHLSGDLGDKDSYICRYCAKWVKKEKNKFKNKDINN